MRKKNSSFHFQSEILNNPLLILACTHKSYSNENSTPNESNERLEFIGDTVLGLIASEFLYKEYPSEQEGRLSKLKSVLVSESSLAMIAKRISLNKYLLLGKGERLTGGAEKDSNLANLTEAVLGAIFLEYGLDTAREWILPELKLILRHSESSENPSGEKSVLQELLQKKFQSLPEYRILAEEGPDHEKLYTIEASFRIKSQIWTETGTGKSKKKAEQSAAKALLKTLRKKKIV